MKIWSSERNKRKQGYILVIGAFIFFAAFLAHAENSIQKDLLLIPSEKTDRAPFSTLMDIVNIDATLLAVGDWGRIIYSDIGCTDWTQADVPVSVALTAAYFPTPQKGWAVGHDGVVLHTKDTGKTWEKQLDGTKINEMMLVQVKELIRIKTEQLENESANSDETRMEELSLDLENLDFFLSDIELAVEEGPVSPLMDIWFKNEQEGIVIGAFGMILSTTDGGNSWELHLDGMDNPNGYHYYGITRSGDDLFIAGEAGLLFRSEDFGKTWKRLASPYEGTFFGIISDPKGGFVTAFGLRGNIFYSIDRGETWSTSDTGTQSSLSGGTFLSDGSFCVVTVGGTVLRSTDKGKTFNALSTKFPGSIALTELKSGVLAAVGLNGFKRIAINP